MRDLLGFVFISICVLTGVLLLYNGVQDTTSTQALPIISGAVFLALAVVMVWAVVKSRREWKKYSKPDPTER